MKKDKLFLKTVLASAILHLFSYSVVAEETASMPSPVTTQVNQTSIPTADENLTSLASGAFLVNEVPSYEKWEALWLFDERPDTGWASPKNVIRPTDFLLELSEDTEFSSFEFDTKEVDALGTSVRELSVSISNEGPTAGFQEILSTTLEEGIDNQRFLVKAPLHGRWLKISLKNNNGSPEYMELMEVKGFGHQLSKTPVRNFSGTYNTKYGNFHLLHNGSRIMGCYDFREGKLLNAGFEGRVLRFTWEEHEGNKRIPGPAVMVFSKDGSKILGLWWFEGQTEKRPGTWPGKRISNEIGKCKHWSPPTGNELSYGVGNEGLEGGNNAAVAELSDEFADVGRVREYGILFDSDSAVLRSESYTRLNAFVALARSKPKWSFSIEGHTDSSSTREHNLPLSENRARSVKEYLVSHGIAESRFKINGYGPDRPVAENSTSFGRSQNRRVEFTLEQK